MTPVAIPPERRLRAEVWSTYPALGGTRRGFLPRRFLRSLVTPDGVDPTLLATVQVVPTADAIAACRPRRVLRVVEFAADGTVLGTPECYRILTDVVDASGGARALTLTAASPLHDWADIGRVRTAPSGGVPSFDLSGYYTPGDALQLCVDALAAAGQTQWAVRTVDRSDAQRLEIVGKTPGEIRALIESTWDVEIVFAVSSDEQTFYVDALSRVGADRAVVPLTLGRTLTRFARTRDATTLATAVQPIGADGATLAEAGWACVVVSGAVLTITDPNGGDGPIQRDGQLVGAAVQAADGTRWAILDSVRADRLTSQVTVSDGSHFASGDPITFRADTAGTRLVALRDPAIGSDTADDYGLVEVPLERSDLRGRRNYVGDPHGTAASVGVSTGWSVGAGTSPGFPPTLTRGVAPAGCPVDNGGVLNTWKYHFPIAGTTVADAGWMPIAPVFDAPATDRTITATLVCYIDAGALSDSTAWLEVGVWDPDAGANIGTVNVTATASWQTVQITCVLGSARRLRLRLMAREGLADGWFENAPPALIWVPFVAIQRGASGVPMPETVEPNLLWQAANAHLLGHRVPPSAIAAEAVERAALDPRAADRPLVPGGDVLCRVPDLGISERARFVSRERERLTPGAPAPLTLVPAPDPAIAAQVAAAAPTRPRTDAEAIRDAIAAAT